MNGWGQRIAPTSNARPAARAWPPSPSAPDRLLAGRGPSSLPAPISDSGDASLPGARASQSRVSARSTWRRRDAVQASTTPPGAVSLPAIEARTVARLTRTARGAVIALVLAVRWASPAAAAQPTPEDYELPIEV